MSKSAPTHYFLTGGTGGLGGELIPRLVAKEPRARLTLLVRAESAAHAQQRLKEVFRYVRHFNPGFNAKNVEAVVGDVAAPGLGLAPGVAAELARSVTHVVHSAASIALRGERAELRRVNLGGTQAVARFAESCGQLQRFLMVSTAYVAGQRSGDILEEELDCGQNFVNHYEESKFAAELHMRSLANRMPITVVRPSIVVGDSRDGHTSSFQNMYVPLYFLGNGAIPQAPGDRRTLLDIAPIDHVAEVMMATLSHPACVGGTYHACAGAASLIPFTVLEDAAKNALRDQPRRTSSRAPLASASQEAAVLVERLSSFFAYLGRSKRFSVDALTRDLGVAAPRSPHPVDYLPRLMSFWQRTQFGQRMPWLEPHSQEPAVATAEAAEGAC